MKRIVFILILCIACLAIAEPMSSRWMGGSLIIAPPTVAGTCYCVDSITGASTNTGLEWASPLADVNQALDKCKPGDKIYAAPGHVEAWSTDAAYIAMDVNGVELIGLGEGDLRPKFTITNVGAVLNITAPNVKISNILIYNNVDAVIADINVLAPGCTLDNVEIRDATLIKEPLIGINTDASADRLTINNFYYNGFQDGDGVTAAINLVGVEGAVITNSRFYGQFSTSVINMATTDCNDILVESCYFYNDAGALTTNIVDTVTGSTWMATNCFDGKGGYEFSGGSGSALAAASTAAIGTDTDAIIANVVDANNNIRNNKSNIIDINDKLRAILYVDVNDKVRAILVNAVDVNDKLRTIVYADVNDRVRATQINATDVNDKLRTVVYADVNDNVRAVKSNVIDVNTNVKDINDKLRTVVYADVNNNVRKIEKATDPVYGRTGSFIVQTDMNTTRLGAATWNTAASHEIATVTGTVRIRMIVECNETLTEAGELATMTLGVEGNRAAIIASTFVAGTDDANCLRAGKMWIDATPATGDGNDVSIYTSAVLDRVVSSGQDVGYTIGTAALTNGTLKFYIWYEALSSDGAVTIGGGGGL
ncbi:MAG: hypothetical protein IMZ53_14040 [Thermoplasmata archaeon]|nr:hypothetical protein [Thermoplasmata archaeon]